MANFIEKYPTKWGLIAPDIAKNGITEINIK